MIFARSDLRTFRLALALALLMLPLPAAAADEHEAAAPAAIRALPLYVQVAVESGPGGAYRALSSLVGDAMPSDGPTHATGGFRALTKRLESPLLLDASRPFEVGLVAAHAPDSYVNATVRVVAFDLLDRETELARAEFRPPPPATDASALVAQTVEQPAAGAPLPVDIGSFLTGLGEVVDATLAEDVGSAAARTAHDRACAISGMVCDQVHGAYGTGQLRFCKARPPVPHSLGWPLYNAVATADATTGAALDQVPAPAPVGSVRLCSGATDVLNESASSASANGSLLRGPAATVFATAANATERPSNASPARVPWERIVPTPSVPAGWMRDDGLFEVPSGMRLALHVSASASPTRTPYVATPVAFEMGRDDAPTNLTLRTADAAAFGRFAAGVELIGPGRHTGHLATPTDADDYAFDVAPGERLRLRPISGEVLYALRDAAGNTVSDPMPTASTPGRWFLRVEHRGASSYVSEYAFDLEALRAAPTETDDGQNVSGGENGGALGPGDDNDTWWVHLWKAQRYTMTYAAAPSLGLTVHAPGTILSSGEGVVEGRAHSTGWHSISLARAHGEGSYSFTLLPDPEGALDTKPMLMPWRTFTPSAAAGLESLIGFPGGVDVLRQRANGSGVLERHTDEGVLTVLNESARPLAHVAGDILVADTPRGVELLAPDGPHLLRGDAEAAAFGPDDALYALLGTEIVRLPADRDETSVRIPQGFDGLQFAPDGTAYMHEVESTTFGNGLLRTYAVDVATGAYASAPEGLTGVQAFDAQGRGYVIHNGSLVAQYDPATNTSRIVAWTPSGNIRDLAFGGDVLYAAVAQSSGEGGITSWSLARVSLGVAGFSGFAPDFHPTAPADLALIGIEEEVWGLAVRNGSVGENHVFRITIGNTGGSVAPPSHASFYRDCSSNCGDAWSLAVPRLEPGANATFTIVWHADKTLGDVEFTLQLDTRRRVVEADEENWYAHQSSVFVGGNEALCRGAIAQMGPSGPLQGYASHLCRPTL